MDKLCFEKKSMSILGKMSVSTVGPWSNGYQCGVRIPRPGV